MYSHTKRIGSVGRYGVKTGKRLRDEIRKIEDAAKFNSCPNCGKKIARIGFRSNTTSSSTGPKRRSNFPS